MSVRTGVRMSEGELYHALTKPLDRFHFYGFEGFASPYLDGRAGARDEEGNETVA
jgi:hypothetical protein